MTARGEMAGVAGARRGRVIIPSIEERQRLVEERTHADWSVLHLEAARRYEDDAARADLEEDAVSASYYRARAMSRSALADAEERLHHLEAASLRARASGEPRG